jgi:hypothetical protein
MGWPVVLFLYAPDPACPRMVDVMSCREIDALCVHQDHPALFSLGGLRTPLAAGRGDGISHRATPRGHLNMNQLALVLTNAAVFDVPTV